MTDLAWRVHTPNLLQEIGNNNQSLAAVSVPLMIFQRLLAEVAERAIELNDHKLNQLMLRLTLYDQADPASPNFQPGLIDLAALNPQQEGSRDHGR